MSIRNFLSSKSKVSRADREWLLCSLLSCSHAELFLKDFSLTPAQKKKFSLWMRKREKGIPLQHITGNAPFYGREFFVSPAVLIPRPETETLVSMVLSMGSALTGDGELSVLDVGTGSGAIALTLKAEHPNWKISASDISAKALSVAKKNAKEHSLKVDFYLSDLLKKAPKDVEFLVSNPPYLHPTKDKITTEVLKHEPRLALIPEKKYKTKISDQGAWIADQLLEQALEKLPNLKRIALELSPRVATILEKRWKKHARVEKIWREADLTGRKRFLLLALH